MYVVVLRRCDGRYEFDYLFDGEATTGDVYQCLGSPIVQGALEGYNGCVRL